MAQGTVEQDLFNFVTVPSPAVYVDILTTSVPQQHASVSCSVPPSSTASLTKVTTSSSGDLGLDSDSWIAEQDMLDGGQYIVMSFMEEGSYGTVARAINSRTCDMVAIKIIKKRKNYDEVAEHEVTIGLGTRVKKNV